MRWALFTAIVISALLVGTHRANAAAPTPGPEATATPVTTLEVGASSEQLSNAHGSWNGSYLTAVRTFAPRNVAYFSIADDQRFTTRDTTYTAGMYTPTSANTILNLELSFSPTHQALPQNAFDVSLDHRLADGWGYTLGAQERSYTGAAVATGSVLVDRYWKSFRAAYRVTGTRLSTAAGLSLAQSALLTHYYGSDDASSVTFSVNTGREVDDLENGVHISAVTGVTIDGVHWTRGRWAGTWSLYTVRQGSIYTRSGIQLGVRARL